MDRWPAIFLLSVPCGPLVAKIIKSSFRHLTITPFKFGTLMTLAETAVLQERKALIIMHSSTDSELWARDGNVGVNISRYYLFSKASLKAFCLQVFHLSGSHLTSATSSGRLAARVEQRKAVSRDSAWLFAEKRSVWRKGCVAFEQCRLDYGILGIMS